MALCFDYAKPVVIQNGLTDLAGGATTLTGELAIFLERMRGPFLQVRSIWMVMEIMTL